MSLFCKVVGLLIVIGVAYLFVQITKEAPLPKVEEKWWGPGEPKKEDPSIKPFKINVPDEIIKDLNRRLNNTLPFQPPLEGAQHNYGLNTNLLAKIVDYWKTKYNWKKRQEFLNQFPQFQTRIQGLNIHFLHVKPKNVPANVEVLPLLLLHGWPGSVREFYEILPILTTPQKGHNFVFEVIAPSLPGYGFSDGAAKQGMHTGVMAQIFDKLMSRLKFNKYYVQGGDWGSSIAHDLAILYPQRVAAVHANMCFCMKKLGTLKLVLASLLPSLFVDEVEAEHNYPLSKSWGFLLLESGYFHLQATKPDTVGAVLRDSPAGLAAYIIEKFITWTNPAWKDLEDGGLSKKYTYDKLLDNVMIYWVTRSITTSVRLYSENFSKKRFNEPFDENRVKVPAACARFKNEVVFPPKFVLEDRFTQLLQLTTYDDGGHFAAFELPEILAKDLFQFIETVRKTKKNPNVEL